MTLPATDPTAYKFWATEHVRFADLDMLGHVNNKAFFTFAESGRVAFLSRSKMWVPGAPRQNVIRKAELEYLRELHYPAEVRVGLRVLKLGSTSFTLGIGMFSNEQCVATALTVLVRIDATSRARVELDETERAALRPYMAT